VVLNSLARPQSTNNFAASNNLSHTVPSFGMSDDACGVARHPCLFASHVHFPEPSGRNLQIYYRARPLFIRNSTLHHRTRARNVLRHFRQPCPCVQRASSLRHFLRPHLHATSLRKDLNPVPIRSGLTPSPCARRSYRHSASAIQTRGRRLRRRLSNLPANTVRVSTRHTKRSVLQGEEQR